MIGTRLSNEVEDFQPPILSNEVEDFVHYEPASKRKRRRKQLGPKNLSLKQVRTCETARGKICHCRCQGQFHGLNRGDTEEFFRSPPNSDPHKMHMDIF